MKYFITGTPGSGKTTIGKILKEKGYKFVDVDHEKGLAHWYNKETSQKVKRGSNVDANWYGQHDWNWDRNNLQNLLKNYVDETIFVSGITSNQTNDLDLFDKVFLLKTDEEELRKRMLQRKSNDNAGPEHVFGWHKTFEEEMLKHGAISIDASQSPKKVVEDILTHC